MCLEAGELAVGGEERDDGQAFLFHPPVWNGKMNLSMLLMKTVPSPEKRCRR